MVAERDLSLFIFNMQLIEGEQVLSHAGSLERMAQLGLPVIPFYTVTNDVEEVIRQIRLMAPW